MNVYDVWYELPDTWHEERETIEAHSSDEAVDIFKETHTERITLVCEMG